MSRLAKIRLLKQFSFGVIAYVLATALVVLLPIFVSPEVRMGRGISRTCCVCGLEQHPLGLLLSYLSTLWHLQT